MGPKGRHTFIREKQEEIESGILLCFENTGKKVYKIFFKYTDTKQEIDVSIMADLFGLSTHTVRKRAMKILHGQGSVKNLFAPMRASNKAKRPFAGGVHSQEELEELRKKNRKDKKSLKRWVNQPDKEYKVSEVPISLSSVEVSAEKQRVCSQYYPFILETTI